MKRTTIILALVMLAGCGGMGTRTTTGTAISSSGGTVYSGATAAGTVMPTPLTGMQEILQFSTPSPGSAVLDGPASGYNQY